MCTAPRKDRSIASDSQSASRIATGVLSIGLLFPLASAPALKNHVIALARAVHPLSHGVRVITRDEEIELTTTAPTVGEALREAGLTLSEGDAVSPPLDTLVSDGMVINYRAAFPVTLVTGNLAETMRTTAETVGDFLTERGITLGPYDRVSPSFDATLDPDATVRISHVVEWLQRARDFLPPIVEHRLDLNLPPTASKTIAKGRAAQRERVWRYRRFDDNLRPERTILESRIVVAARPRIVASGIVAYERYARLASRAARGTVRLATAAVRMLATAYTPYCGGGCSGYTALGARAGYGIVAVDPGFIPLGTRLYIPGYGRAVAGDTGGAIRGRRIDLGFESDSDAMRFGTREIVVYVLK